MNWDHVLALVTVDALCILCPVVCAAVDDWRWRSWGVAGAVLCGLGGILSVHLFMP